MVRSLELQEDMKGNVKITMWVRLNEYQWLKPIEYVNILCSLKYRELKVVIGML